jgi:hypothetical protein
LNKEWKSIWALKQGKVPKLHLFERIAAAEPSKWLPNYYVALVNTAALELKTKKSQFITKAQNALSLELAKIKVMQSY